MRILSLFDGVSCGQLALKRAGFNISKYYAAEIDKYAIATTQKNFPNTIQLGDVMDIDFEQFKGKIDMIIGGSPCQKFSIAKSGRETNLEGEGGKLFKKFKEAVDTIQPKYFLLENVASMHKDVKEAISRELGVEPILINSALVSAQQRKRLYWCNWKPCQLTDKGILLEDIVENGEVWNKKSYCLTATYNKAHFPRDYPKGQRQMIAIPCALRSYPRNKSKTTRFKRLEIKQDGKANAMTSTQTDSLVCSPIRIGELNGSKSQGNRIYSVRGKSICLSANGGGLGAKTGLYKIDLPDGDYAVRKLTPIECERLQTLPDNYTAGVSNTQRIRQCGNGWTVDVIVHILRGLAQT